MTAGIGRGFQANEIAKNHVLSFLAHLVLVSRRSIRPLPFPLAERGGGAELTLS